VNALTPFIRTATPLSLTRGGKTARALRRAEQRDAEQHDYRLPDRFGYHPVHALAIREARFDWARPIDGVKRGPVWRKHGQDTDVVLDRNSRPGPAWFSASSFDAAIPRVPDDSLVWHDDRQIGYLREVPLALEFYSSREGRYRRHCWGAWSPDRWLGIYPTRAAARGALLRNHTDAGNRWAAEHPGRMLVDPDDSAKPSIGRHYARWTRPGAKNKGESLSAFERLCGQIMAWRKLAADEEREHVERYRRDRCLHPRLLRPAHIAAKAAARKWCAGIEDLFAVAAAAMPAVLDEFDPSRNRLSTFAQRPLQWAIADYLTATGLLHPGSDPKALAKAEVLRPLQLVAPAPSAAADDGDDEGDSDYSADEAWSAWRADVFDADALSSLSGLLARLEDGIAKDVVTVLLGGDLTQKEIAAQLNVSEPTVSRALAKAYAKLRNLAAVPEGVPYGAA
jgi:RNA polymerase sigma factor (sigma-70 family)